MVVQKQKVDSDLSIIHMFALRYSGYHPSRSVHMRVQSIQIRFIMR